jgi:error-prone DNA polymerase
VTYVELRAHSAFSFGDGAVTPEALAARAAELGYPALGLTDTADLGGIIRFALAAGRHGIRPIVGAELRVEGRPVALLARTAEGYRNLAALVTRARVGSWGGWCKEGEDPGAAGGETAAGPAAAAAAAATAGIRGVPALGFDEVAARAAGLHLLTGPAEGELAWRVRAGEQAAAERALARWRECFEGRMAVEVQLHHVSGQEAAVAAALIELAGRARVPWVAANDPRYLDGGGRLVHDLLTALRADMDVNTAASWGLLHPNGEWRLKSPAEMARLWAGRPAGLEESVRIAAECGFQVGWVRPPLPRFPVPAGHDDDSFLRQLAFAGALERWGGVDERQRAQLEHELGVIGRLGFAGFFLVMWDAVRFARSRSILCQGRGSAANSVVAYCLGITAVDPVRHGLLFERFLSEHRTDGLTEAPDIDVDFEMHRREEVLDYMYRTYRREHAAITCVAQSYHAPAAVQDVMRALGYPAELALRISKRLHGAEPADAAAALEGGLAETVGLERGEPRARALLAALRALDEVPRLRSTHPGGFVLSSEPLGDYLPIEGTTMGRTILQFDKDDLDAAGIPKFDFLGLGGLSAVHLAFDAIERRTGERLELYRLPVDDAATFEMISRGDVIGTFQIESRAQIQSILQTRPERLYDLVVQVALIRPGPIQARFVRPYTRRRRGLEPVRYAHPLLEPILRRTYGIPVFQEQAMAISMALGGFTAAEADELRRSMGHRRKLPRLHAALERLRARIVARGVAEAVAGEIVEDLHSFANYGFPESHAWSFALIAYATAYLKAHYPAEFALGLLNAWPMGFYPPATLVHDARRHGVEVRAPCLRDGAWECTLEAASTASSSGGRVGAGNGVFKGESGEGHGARGASPGCAGDRLAPATRGHDEAGEVIHDIEDDWSAAAVSGSPALSSTGNPPRPSASPPCSLRLKAVDVRCPAPVPALRVGWRFIQGLGEKARQALQEARAEGTFTSIEDVVRRARLSRGDALHLARAGAFEAFQPGRRRAAWEALRAAGDVLPLAPARLLPFEPAELEGEELIFLDYLATGISVRGHPVEHLRERLRAAGVAGSAELDGVRSGDTVVVAGLVVARQHPSTAKGTVFVLLEDEDGYINVIVPDKLYQANREVVRFSPFLLVEGTFEREGRVLNVVGRRFRQLRVRQLAFRSRDFH